MLTLSRRSALLFFNLIALTVIIHLVVDIFYTLLISSLNPTTGARITKADIPMPAENDRVSIEAYQTIMKRNIFGTYPAAMDENEIDIQALEPTSLKISLLGTVTGSPEGTYAVIEESEKKTQNLLRVGDSIENAKIEKILDGKVIIRVGDKDQVLTMEEVSPKDSGGIGPSKRARVIKLSIGELQESFENINRLLAQVRVRPHFRSGRAEGFLVSRIRPNSIFSRMGLQDGDVIYKINGKVISSPDDVFDFYKDLRSGSHASLGIIREGKIETLYYDFR
nr:PDZ domain-containing protein [Desulfobacterales bacterium]